jgi:ferric-dicitrate binding protein FerR (iron transport regulator)
MSTTDPIRDTRTKHPDSVPPFDPSELDALLNDPAFRRWVYAPTDADEQSWQTWLHQRPERRPLVEAARQVLLDVRGEVPRLTDSELDTRIADLLHQTEAPGRSVVRFWPRRYLGYAAAVLAVLGAVALWRGQQRSTVPVQAERAAVVIRRVAVENTGTRPRLVTLGDGSSVLLQTGSRLVYEVPFRATSRRVWLAGEAFFEVRKRPRQPFRVRAGNRFTTEVLGTSFRIRAYAGAAPALVAVKTGRVSVYQSATPDHRPEAVLSARQQALIRPARPPEPVASTTVTPGFVIERQSFEFRAVPLRDVLAVLEKSYGVTIQVSPALANCLLTASLGDEPLPEKIRLIGLALDADYQFSGEQIRLTGEGCLLRVQP